MGIEDYLLRRQVLLTGTDVIVEVVGMQDEDGSRSRRGQKRKQAA